MHQPPHSPLGPQASGGTMLDRILPRLVTNTVGLIGVALTVFWITDHQANKADARLAGLADEVRNLRADRDRAEALSRELAREAQAADVSAEVLRWQLRYTEEKLARAKDSQQRPAFRSISAAPTVIESLDPQADARMAKDILGRIDHASALIEASGDDGAAFDPLYALYPSPEDGDTEPLRRGGLDLDDFETNFEFTEVPTSQLDRDRAYGKWSGVVDESVAQECGRLHNQNRAWKCENEIRRALWVHSGAAVNCVMSGNATPDYVANIGLENLPSHSIPLERGAVILCDGALSNL